MIDKLWKAATALVLAGALFPLTAASAQAHTGQSGSHLDWGPCPDGDGKAEVECASLKVPVNWDEPYGRKITLTLGRLPSNGTAPAEGSVLVAFGGPVGTYIELLRTVYAGSFTELRRRMNIVTWDIRGGVRLEGLSTALPCDWTRIRVPDYPRSRAEFEKLAAANRAVANECRAKDPALFDHMSSADHARDMEAIRRALGERRLNFYGSSYGGFFGQAYARLFPHRVRTMVLDGTLNHSTSNWDRELVALTKANERSMQRFFDWCAADQSCALHDRDVSGVWQELIASANASPIPAPQVDAEYDGRNLQTLGLALARQGPEQWVALARAIVDAERGDASGFAPPGGIGSYPRVPTPPVVECLDWPRPTSHARLKTTLSRLNRIAPHTGAASPLLMNMLLCAGWPTPVTNPPRPLPRHLPPLLGAGNWNEIEATRRVIAQVPGSSSIYHDGPGHTLYFNNTCARTHINRYLTRRVLPPRGTEC